MSRPIQNDETEDALRGEEIISILIYIRKVIKKSLKAKTSMEYLQQETPLSLYSHINISLF